MTNRLAVILAILLIGVFCADLFYFDWGLPVFLGRKLAEFIEYIAFWR